jgi:hypothetical protein
MSSTTDKYRTKISDRHRDYNHSGWWIRLKRGETGSSLCESAGGKEKAAEEGAMRRGKIQLQLSGTSGLCLGITRHPCDKPHALFVQQPSAAEGCERVVGEGRKARLGGAPDADILREAIAELHPKDNSRSNYVSSQSESVSRRICERSRRRSADRAIASKYVPMKLHDRTNWAVFIWQEPLAGKRETVFIT